MKMITDSLITQEDLRQIESVLYREKEDELIGRKAFQSITEFTPGAEEIGFDSFSRQGSAKILAAGAGAADVPMVDGDKVRHTQKVFTLANGFNIDRRRLKALEASNTNGKGPQINDETLKIETARRFMAELEDRIVFNGDADHGIDGVLTHTGISSEVSTSATAWASATPTQILADLREAKDQLENAGFFKARLLVISPTAWNVLQQPFSTETIITLAQWLQTQGSYFDQIMTSRTMLNAFNGSTFSDDIFLVVDNDPENIQLALVEDMVLNEPERDFLGNLKFSVVEEFGGPMIRHPSAIAVRTGI